MEDKIQPKQNNGIPLPIAKKKKQKSRGPMSFARVLHFSGEAERNEAIRKHEQKEAIRQYRKDEGRKIKKRQEVIHQNKMKNVRRRKNKLARRARAKSKK